MPLSRAKTKRILHLAGLSSYLVRRLRESGDGVPERIVREEFGIGKDALRGDLRILAGLRPRSGGYMEDQGLDAYIERGRVFYFGPASRLRPLGLGPEELSSLRAAAGLLAGTFPPDDSRFLRAFARNSASPRAPAPSPPSRVAFQALEQGRSLVRPSGEILIPLALAWYQGQPCLEVTRAKKLRAQSPRFLLRLDRFPPCRLGRPVIPSRPSEGGGRSRLKPGVRGRIRLSGGALRRFREEHRGTVQVLLAGSREELLRRVLRLGSEARVLGPDWLKAAVRSRALESVKA